MTAIVGLEHKGKVYIGADSAGVSGYSITVRADEKVFTNGQFLMAFTSSFRMGQILRYKFTPPRQTKGQDDMEFMVCNFIDAVRKCFKVAGVLRTREEVESGGTILIGYKGKLYCVENDFQVARSVAPYQAAGVGEDLALGALFATEGMDPTKRVDLALRAAAFHNGGVIAPFKTMST